MHSGVLFLHTICNRCHLVCSYQTLLVLLLHYIPNRKTLFFQWFLHSACSQSSSLMMISLKPLTQETLRKWKWKGNERKFNRPLICNWYLLLWWLLVSKFQCCSLVLNFQEMYYVSAVSSVRWSFPLIYVLQEWSWSQEMFSFAKLFYREFPFASSLFC